MPSVLVTRRIYPEAMDFLQERCDVDCNGVDESLIPEELLLCPRGKPGIVSQLTDSFPASVIASLDGIRELSNVAVGFDNTVNSHT